MHRKLRGRIVEKYGTMKCFADELGMTPTNLSRYFTGKCNFRNETIEKWIVKLDIEKEDIPAYFFAD